MPEKTIVLRKNGHWYVINSRNGDEQEIILTLIELAENRKYDINISEVNSLMDQLGWRIEVHIPGMGAA